MEAMELELTCSKCAVTYLEHRAVCISFYNNTSRFDLLFLNADYRILCSKLTHELRLHEML